jgi:rRNA maturation endonuclease Nob1
MSIKCTNCNSIYEIVATQNPTLTCEYCHEELVWEEINNSVESANIEVVNLIWTKQRDATRFTVSKNSSGLQLIGRQHCGSEVLSTISQNNVPIISKTHCSVEFVENNVYLKDEGSTNGTYLGIEKISCLKRQLLKNNQTVWLATEPFNVSFEFKTESASENTKNTIQGFRCNACGKTFDEKHETCLSCGEYNSFTAL